VGARGSNRPSPTRERYDDVVGELDGAPPTRALPSLAPTRDAPVRRTGLIHPHGGFPSLKPPARHELGAGDVIAGKYHLVELLGEGGMGSVWVAHNATLDIHVAIKVIRADLAGGARLSDRMLQEARAAAQLGHPAIVRISDFGATDSGDPFVVMELLAGEDLAAVLERRGRLSPVKAIRTLLPVAHALVTAHDKKIVHRDIKPENIFLARAEDGGVQPKLIDFGVAKLNRSPSERLTMVGAVMGSPGYMPPEQARGDDVDMRADIWSLCAVLYELVTGRLPFQGKNYNALLRSIIEDEPPPVTNFGIGDAALWEVVRKGLAKNPDERWPSMRRLGAALADWLLSHDVTEDICGTSLTTAWLPERRRRRVGEAFDSWAPGRPPSIHAPAHVAVPVAVAAAPPRGDAAPASEVAPSARGRIRSDDSVPLLDPVDVEEDDDLVIRRGISRRLIVAALAAPLAIVAGWAIVGGAGLDAASSAAPVESSGAAIERTAAAPAPAPEASAAPVAMSAAAEPPTARAEQPPAKRPQAAPRTTRPAPTAAPKLKRPIF
jgi:serine/threonine-protein kinase